MFFYGLAVVSICATPRLHPISFSQPRRKRTEVGNRSGHTPLLIHPGPGSPGQATPAPPLPGPAPLTQGGGCRPRDPRGGAAPPPPAGLKGLASPAWSVRRRPEGPTPAPGPVRRGSCSWRSSAPGLLSLLARGWALRSTAAAPAAAGKPGPSVRQSPEVRRPQGGAVAAGRGPGGAGPAGSGWGAADRSPAASALGAALDRAPRGSGTPGARTERRSRKS